MGKLKCKCGLPAHVMIKAKAHCLKCVPKPEQKPEQEEKLDSSCSESSSSSSSADVEPLENKQSIELRIDKIGPIVKSTKKKSWWAKFLGYSGNPFYMDT